MIVGRMCLSRGRKGKRARQPQRQSKGEVTLKRKRMAESTLRSSQKYSEGVVACSALAKRAQGVNRSETSRRSLNQGIRGGTLMARQRQARKRGRYYGSCRSQLACRVRSKQFLARNLVLVRRAISLEIQVNQGKREVMAVTGHRKVRYLEDPFDEALIGGQGEGVEDGGEGEGGLDCGRGTFSQRRLFAVCWMTSSVNIILLPSPFKLHINTAIATQRTLNILALSLGDFSPASHGLLGREGVLLLGRILDEKCQAGIRVVLACRRWQSDGRWIGWLLLREWEWPKWGSHRLCLDGYGADFSVCLASSTYLPSVGTKITPQISPWRDPYPLQKKSCKRKFQSMPNNHQKDCQAILFGGNG